MIVVTVQLRSAHGRKHDKVLGEAVIYNDGTGTDRRGNYHYDLRGKTSRSLRSGDLRGFARRSRTAWELLHEVLTVEFGRSVTRWTRRDVAEVKRRARKRMRQMRIEEEER